jgi:hypothetical protein
VIATAETFSHAHIAATAATTGVICAGIAVWRITGRRRIALGLVIGLLAGFAVFLWRASANMPQLNNDGLSGYSANDWLAPVVVFVVLSVYADLVPPSDPRRFRQVRALATIVAFAVNVITI